MDRSHEMESPSHTHCKFVSPTRKLTPWKEQTVDHLSTRPQFPTCSPKRRTIKLEALIVTGITSSQLSQFLEVIEL
eukprot:758484-Hanusia_phi.AAC.2